MTSNALRQKTYHERKRAIDGCEEFGRFTIDM